MKFYNLGEVNRTALFLVSDGLVKNVLFGKTAQNKKKKVG